jgi:nucleoside-diphosphate-sugar epimerase
MPTNPPLHVVVGSGPLGRAVARALLADGRRVRIVSRSGRGVEGAEAVSADISADHTYAAGAQVLYQCAQPAYHRWLVEFPALQRQVLEAAARAGARLVVADNLYAFGDGGGHPISDDSPRIPRSRKGELRAAMAAEALEAHAAGRVELALTQPSDYVGGGYHQFDASVVTPALRGRRMQFIGALDQPHSFSYVPDAGRAMAAIGTSELGWGRSWITPVLPAITQGELAARVWRAAGRTDAVKVSGMSKGAARVLGAFIPDLGALVEMWYEFDAPYVVESSGFERTFGVTASSWDAVIDGSVSPR